jgi:16S rRNA processing protein RimM
LTDASHERQAKPAGSATRLIAGRVGRAHGLDGSFYVTRPRPRLLVEGAVLTAGTVQAPIVRRAGTDAKPIVRLQGISSREQAEALRGIELSIDDADAPALGDGEWWAHELEGCAVFDGEREVGRVLRMLELPSCEALEVAPVGGGETLLVPMVKDAVRLIAPGEGRIDVDLDFLGLAPAQEQRDRGAAPEP